jgi:hypothetical protein
MVTTVKNQSQLSSIWNCAAHAVTAAEQQQTAKPQPCHKGSQPVSNAVITPQEAPQFSEGTNGQVKALPSPTNSPENLVQTKPNQNEQC